MPLVKRKKVLCHPLPSASALLGNDHLPVVSDLSIPSTADRDQIPGEGTKLEEVRERHLREYVRKLKSFNGTSEEKKKVSAAGWKEPEVYLVESTGEIFQDYE